MPGINGPEPAHVGGGNATVSIGTSTNVDPSESSLAWLVRGGAAPAPPRGLMFSGRTGVRNGPACVFGTGGALRVVPELYDDCDHREAAVTIDEFLLTPAFSCMLMPLLMPLPLPISRSGSCIGSAGDSSALNRNLLA